MGRQSKLKESRRKFRKKNQRRSAKYCVAEFCDLFQVDSDGPTADQGADLEFGEIIKLLMPDLPFFSGMNYESWTTEIKTVLWKLNLLNYIEDVINDSGDTVALSLITSAVDDNIIFSIIYEYGEIPSTKFLWDVLEMKNCLNKGNDATDIALDNDPVFYCETEDAMMGDACVSVIETCNDENTSIIVEPESFHDVEPESFPDAEIKFDETYISHDEWINLMIEKHQIDELLFGEKDLISSHTDQMQNMLVAIDLDEGIIMSTEKDEVRRDGEMKALLKEQEDENIGRQGSTINFEEELKFLEAWLETPCLYEINTEVAVINGEDVITDVQMIDTENSEQEQSPIEPAIILRRMRTRNQGFLHRGSNEAKLHHYLMAKKVKMKPHPRMNKYGLRSIKTKMKTLLPSFF